MKTHTLAKALIQLARILNAGPNIDLNNLRLEKPDKPEKKDSLNILVNISTLSALSRIGKREWVSFIEQYDLPIDVKTRDSSRNIIGKILNCLDKAPEAREKLKRTAEEESAQASPELLKALSALMKD